MVYRTRSTRAPWELDSVVMRLQRQLRLDGDPDRSARHRAEWPELWGAIDAVVAKLEEKYPPDRGPGAGLFDGSFVRLPHQTD